MGGVCATPCVVANGDTCGVANCAFGAECATGFVVGATGVCAAAVKEARAKTASESEAKMRMVDPRENGYRGILCRRRALRQEAQTRNFFAG
jgi:hypothetical protein